MASKDSAFGIPEVKRGLVAGGGGLLRLPQRIPSAIAMELALTGENLTAERAHELGMVNVLAEPGHGAGRRDRAGREDRRQRAARGGRHQADHRRVPRLDPETMFAEQNKILGPVFVVQRRQGGRDRVRREARAPLDRDLTRGPWRPSSYTMAEICKGPGIQKDRG